MASLRRKGNGWELRYRQRDGRARSEFFRGGTAKRAPEEAADRKAEVESQLRRGTYVAREDLEAPFQVYFDRWWATRQVSETRLPRIAVPVTSQVLPCLGFLIAVLPRDTAKSFMRFEAARACAAGPD